MVIRRYMVTDASVHDSQELETILDPNNEQELWADSAYRSEEQEARLKERGITSHIHERAYRNKPPRRKTKNNPVFLPVSLQAPPSLATPTHIFDHYAAENHRC